MMYESKAFPRTKVCGEYISPAATAELESLIGAEQLEQAGAQRVDRYVLQVGNRARTWETPGEAWALSRRTLDTMLVEQAKACGVCVRQPIAVREALYHDDGVEIVTGTGKRCPRTW